MSMPFLVFTCTACDYQGSDTVVWGGFTYEHQSKHVPIDRRLGWCDSCGGLAPVEQFPSNTTVRQLEADIENKASRVNHWKAEAAQNRSLIAKLLGSKLRLPSDIKDLDHQRSYREDDLRRERDRLDLLAGRSSMPKCLICGSHDCKTLPDFEPSGTSESPGPAIPIGMNHPRCSGALLVAHSGIEVSRRLSHRFYDRDGNLLRQEKVK